MGYFISRSYGITSLYIYIHTIYIFKNAHLFTNSYIVFYI